MAAPGLAKSSKFVLSSATVMLGAEADLLALNAEEHALGLVKNFQTVVEPSYTELMQGIQNDVVESVRTGDGLRGSFELYEYTAKNLAYAAGLNGATLVEAAANTFPVNTAITGASEATSVVVTGDMTTTPVSLAAGDFISIQEGDGSEHVHIAKVASATFATSNTTITLATDFEIPAGVSFTTAAKVKKVNKLELGGATTQPMFSAKVVGVMPKDGRAFVMYFPKVKITRGFSVSLTTENFSNLPMEFTPYPTVVGDPMYSHFPNRKMVVFPA